MLILLVEDHEDSRRATSMLLTMLGHQVVGAGDGAAALAAVDERQRDGKAQFDVALIDLGLPEQPGTAVMDQIRRRCSIRGIALTGRTDDADIADALRAGFSAYLAKPVSVEQLEDALRQR